MRNADAEDSNAADFLSIVSVRCGTRGHVIAMSCLVRFANNLIRISEFCFRRMALERR